MNRRDLLKGITAGAWAGLLPLRAGEKANPLSGTASATEEIVWSRKVPVHYEADVAVIGGGIAGVSAACAAATTGGVAAFCGETRGQGEVFDAIVADLSAFRAVAPYQPYVKRDARIFDHHILAVVLQELLVRRGVKLLLHTRFVDVRVMEGGRIAECVVCGKSGPEALRAKQFVDCTGEADVARRAGFAVMKGRPEDGLQLPMSMMAFVRHVEEKDAPPLLPEGWLTPIRDKADLPMVSVWPNGPRGHALKIKIPMFDATSTESMAAAEMQARRRTLEVVDYYQRVGKKPWRYDGCSPQIGIREGARIVGDYLLTVADLRAGMKFDDAVARGVYTLDAHKLDDDKRTYVLPEGERRVPPYQIPLRALIAKEGANLLMAGRCCSADQLALSSVRVSTTCSMMGQAAGMAAALAVQRKTDPRRLGPSDVRRLVEARGGCLT
jgi:hypothetical protein